ncbi:hypothetical protein TRFO_12869 [Tritrichomonas foetus]|uniref:Nitroreductase domain-containing protein n=1 Tax=Tritrichomonas foetus TaxID=1144522 RepID=A0A1J4L013_9EUKA|nr:hypothetical protein TRFO_12869 [Tritrichomonas foetus]|eukprot:OHT16803.1 hypothetical protein TRFO_12869 [Tritrichomonas foetus]
MSNFNVLVPGYFTSIQSCHAMFFNKIKEEIAEQKSILSDLIKFHLLIFPQNGFPLEETQLLLSSFSFCSGTHTIPQKNSQKEIDCLINDAKIDCVVVFEETIFNDWQISKKHHKNLFIFISNLQHPDLLASSHLFNRRYSPSNFTGEHVSDAILKEVISAARRSPSAGNLQAYSIIFVKNRDVIKQIADVAHRQEKITFADGVAVFVMEKELSAAKYRSRGMKLYSLQDATIACSHLQLAFESFGIQSRWIGAFKDEDMQRVLNLGNKEVAGLLIYGYGIKSKHQSKRRDINQFVSEIV